MASITAPKENYVRFLRGTPTAYANLSIKDSDTLYFISEKDANSGVLYLGDKLISGAGNITVFSSIAQLTDVIINEVSDGDFLVYDGESNKWVNKDPSEIAGLIVEVMKGATANDIGKSGLVPTPQAGDQNKFLRGDGTWATVVGSISQSDIEDISKLKTTVATLVGNDTGKSVREIAVKAIEEILIPADAKESLNTLQEIANWIQNDHPDISKFDTRISSLESIMYDKQSETDFDDDGNPVIIPGLQTIVSNLSIAMNDVQQDIVNIYESIRWQDMEE